VKNSDRRLALRLWEQGLTFRQLAVLLGVNRTTVREIVKAELDGHIRALLQAKAKKQNWNK
jgi:DNA-binding CsgD family transcriptional regulator